MPSAAINAFRQNLTYVRNLIGLTRALSGTTTAAMDLSDVLRAALVQVVSAFDHYNHERVREGMIQVHRGLAPRTLAFDNFQVPMSVVGVALASPGVDSWLEAEIVRQNSIRTYQKAERVADCFRLISPTPLWDTVASDLGAPAADLKRRLDLIVDRRNQIAHEADLDPSNPGVRWPISDADVEQAADFIERIVDSFEKIA